jgi:hypothetical protein
MNLEEARARVKARVWQALAQSDLDIKNYPQADLEGLVDLMATAALLEVDDEIGASIQTESVAKTAAVDADDGSSEQVLWEGRPFLSINTRYIITDERVRVIEGVLGKDRADVELVRVQDIDQSQSVSERLLNMGDITLHTHDRTNPKVELRNVRDPEAVHELLRRAVLNARKRHKLTYREEM